VAQAIALLSRQLADQASRNPLRGPVSEEVLDWARNTLPLPWGVEFVDALEEREYGDWAMLVVAVADPLAAVPLPVGSVSSGGVPNAEPVALVPPELPPFWPPWVGPDDPPEFADGVRVDVILRREDGRSPDDPDTVVTRIVFREFSVPERRFW